MQVNHFFCVGQLFKRLNIEIAHHVAGVDHVHKGVRVLLVDLLFHLSHIAVREHRVEETMSKTVTKADIAKSICAQSEMKQQHAKKVLDAMLGIMKKALKEEKEMLLSGFGKFEAFTKKNRKGRNPQTGEEITLDSHDVLAFRISRKFKAAMNSEQ